MMKTRMAAVETHRDLILDAFNYIWTHPETGYREVQTSRYLEDVFESLGYELTRAGDIPGFCTVVDTGRPGPEVLVLGEMDSLICNGHPEADPQTGAVHCCGHCAQSAALVGIAAALKEPGVLDGLSGRIRLCAVPAEEMIEIEYRAELIRQGRIRYLGGKQEFLARGLFDGVDLALMVHTTSGDKCLVEKGSIGFVTKRVVYKGVTSHAGGNPWDGCNALYAATLGINAVNAVRETFRDADKIRVHPIITHGGDVVNAIPDKVVMESYVRGGDFDAIRNANERVNRALCGAALAMGANVDIQDKPGYAPLNNCDAMMDVACEAAEAIGEKYERSMFVGSGSTDMGDLSCLMPVVHPHVPGAVGRGHSEEYFIQDPYRACVVSAKWQLAMLTLLLQDGAARAKRIAEEFHPRFAGKEAYLAYMDTLFSEGNRIDYHENGSADVNLYRR